MGYLKKGAGKLKIPCTSSTNLLEERLTVWRANPQRVESTQCLSCVAKNYTRGRLRFNPKEYRPRGESVLLDRQGLNRGGA